jgi:hypothetical protein
MGDQQGDKQADRPVRSSGIGWTCKATPNGEATNCWQRLPCYLCRGYMDEPGDMDSDPSEVRTHESTGWVR